MSVVLLACWTAFAGDGAFDHSHAAFDGFLEGAVSTAGVDYGALAARRAQLDGYLAAVATAPLGEMSPPQQLALWVNAYNAYTLQLVLDNAGIASIRDLDGGNPWDKRTFTVGGQQKTLNQMEHEHARKLADGRVHAVVNCAAVGCPPLPPDPLLARTADAQLTAASKVWAGHNAFTLEGSTLRLSKIFEWYHDDFTAENEGDLPGVDGAHENGMWFLMDKVDAATAARFKGGSLSVDWQDYDWKLNRR